MISSRAMSRATRRCPASAATRRSNSPISWRAPKSSRQRRWSRAIISKAGRGPTALGIATSSRPPTWRATRAISSSPPRRSRSTICAFLWAPLPRARRAASRPRLGLAVADKPDSQDICFVPEGRYADLIMRLRPDAAEPGDIVHEDGRVLGRHKGTVILHRRPAAGPRHRRGRSALCAEDRCASAAASSSDRADPCSGMISLLRR